MTDSTDIANFETYQPYEALLKALVGQQIDLVTLMEVTAGLYFSAGIQFILSGEWRLRGPDGALIDRNVQRSQRDSFSLWRLAGMTVASVRVETGSLPFFTLRTTEGYELDACNRPGFNKAPVVQATLIF